MIILLLIAHLCYHLFQGRILLHGGLSQQTDSRERDKKRLGYVVTWMIVMLLIAYFCYHLLQGRVALNLLHYRRLQIALIYVQLQHNEITGLMLASNDVQWVDWRSEVVRDWYIVKVQPANQMCQFGTKEYRNVDLHNMRRSIKDRRP